MRSGSQAWTFVPAGGESSSTTQHMAFASVPSRVLTPGSCSWWFEHRGREAGYPVIAGVDEVGRGALFGPVVAAAVVLDPETTIEGIRDSKRLTPNRREALAEKIRRSALSFAIAQVDAQVIDRINILEASRLAMRNAVESLAVPARMVLVDAVRLDLPVPQVSIIRGDGISVSIAAASIVAKVARDRLIVELDRECPGYCLAQNKGYGTADHMDCLRRMGPSPLHRRSFAPVAECAGALAAGGSIRNT